MQNNRQLTHKDNMKNISKMKYDLELHELELKEMEARVYLLNIRTKTKYTVTEIESIVSINKEVQDKRRLVLKLKYEFEISTLDSLN